MSKIDYAALSAAAYANFSNDKDKEIKVGELNTLLGANKAKFNYDDSPVVDSDAERFSRDFEVVHSADFIPGDKDGFSATDR